MIKEGQALCPYNHPGCLLGYWPKRSSECLNCRKVNQSLDQVGLTASEARPLEILVAAVLVQLHRTAGTFGGLSGVLQQALKEGTFDQ